MALSFLYRLAVRLVDILPLRRMSDADKDVEIVVLRYQLDVLRRQLGRTRFEPADRALLSLSVASWPAGDARRPRPFTRRPPSCARIAMPFAGAGPIHIDLSAGRPSPCRG